MPAACGAGCILSRSHRPWPHSCLDTAPATSTLAEPRWSALTRPRRVASATRPRGGRHGSHERVCAAPHARFAAHSRGCSPGVADRRPHGLRSTVEASALDGPQHCCLFRSHRAQLASSTTKDWRTARAKQNTHTTAASPGATKGRGGTCSVPSRRRASEADAAHAKAAPSAQEPGGVARGGVPRQRDRRRFWQPRDAAARQRACREPQRRLWRRRRVGGVGARRRRAG